MSNIKDRHKQIMEDLKNEQIAQKQTIQNAVVEELKNVIITEDNLSPNLKAKIMAKQQQQFDGDNQKREKKQIGDKKQDSKMVRNENFPKIIDDLRDGLNVYLYGLAGTGKTVLAEQVAEVLCDPTGEYQMGSVDPKAGIVVPFRTINCSQWTSPMQIIGGYSIKGYEEGQLELAWKYGGVLILDELPKLDPNTAGLLNDALAKSGRKNAVITNGKGDAIPKHPDFMCVGTGNTDMKSTSANFSGNNRQDYSLVDRFVGSMYKIGRDLALEQTLIHTAVLKIADGIRAELPADSIEAITLRSMINFNTSYRLEMLRRLESPLAETPFETTSEEKRTGEYYKKGKTLKDAVDSFLDSLGESRKDAMILKAKFKSIKGQNEVNYYDIIEQATVQNQKLFIDEYKRMKGVDPLTGKEIVIEKQP
jgi:hypothetical protein